jgi:methionyl-tRNA synthetase
MYPKDVVEKYYQEHLKLIQKGDLSFDIYTKTTTENHKKIVQDFFLKLLLQGYIIRKTTRQFYSKEDNKFLPDRYVKGICPFCQSSNINSDQCDTCGKIIDPEELINPVSKLTQSPVILKETEHYFID